MRHESGFTLIELLVSMAIAAIISLFMLSTYQVVTVGGLNDDAFVGMQDSARNALTLMTNDIDAAGYLLDGTSGIGRCTNIITYNSNNTVPLSPLYAVNDTSQTSGAIINGTNISIDYPVSSSTPSDAVTLVYNNANGSNASIGNGDSVGVSTTTQGTINNASLVLSNTNGFQANDIDIVVLPTLNACIRMQITNIGGANNIIHNSGLSNLNPSGGFSAFDSLLPRAITTTDLSQAVVQDMGNAASGNGLVQVTYSIRNVNNIPVLYRTVVDENDTLLQDSGIANNVVYLRALYAPLSSNGTIGSFVSWNTIVANKQQNVVGAIEFALLLQRKNVGNQPTSPASIQVLDISYPTSTGYSYQVFSKIMYLNNVAWSQS